MTEIKRLEFSEGVVTTKPTDLVPNSPDGLETISVTDSDSPLTLIVNRRYFADTTSGAIAATTPAGPSNGDRMQIIDNGNAFDTNNFTVTAASGTINGAASDVLKTEGEVVEYVYDAANTNWAKLAFGSGGGLSNDGVQKIAAFTADANREYFLKTDAGTFEIELPVLAAGAAVRFVDSTGFWSTNPPTVVDNGGTGFNGAVGSPLELDVGGSWIEFTANVDDSTWETKGPNAAEGSQAATSSEAGVVLKNKWQNITLFQDLTSGSADISLSTGNGSFKFNNLVVGKVYKVTLHPFFESTGTSSAESYATAILHDGVIRSTVRHRNDGQSDTSAQAASTPAIFTATTTTVIFNFSLSGSATLKGDDSFNETWARIEEINNYEPETSDFT